MGQWGVGQRVPRLRGWCWRWPAGVWSGLEPGGRGEGGGGRGVKGKRDGRRGKRKREGGGRGEGG